MDFIQMSQGAEGSVTFSINWDAITTFAQSLTEGQWWLLALGISVVYGIVTHSRSLMQISRWNKKMDARYAQRLAEWNKPYADHEPERHAMEKELVDWELVPMAIYRLFLNLPIRIIMSALGSVGILVLFGASGKIRTNGAFRWGWGWTLRPGRLRSIMNDGPGGMDSSNWNDENYA